MFEEGGVARDGLHESAVELFSPEEVEFVVLLVVLGPVVEQVLDCGLGGGQEVDCVLLQGLS